MHTGLKWLSAVTAAGMFFVLLGGALVTNTGSARGCGSDWPLCHGKFIPAYTLESLIEYSHRAVTGVVGLLVVAVVIGVWWSIRDRKDARLYAGGALFFTLLQAALGAMAVKWPQASAVLALHFGLSLLAVASTLMVAIVVWRYPQPLVSRTEPGQAGARGVRASRVTRGFRNLVWLTAIYTYIVIYIGAFVRHTDSAAGCSGWPLCNGEWIPTLSSATGIVFGHRAAVLLLFVLVCLLVGLAWRNYQNEREVYRGSLLIGLFLLLQIASGAWVSQTVASEDAFVFAALVHATIVTGLFALLCYECICVWYLRRDRPKR